MKKVKAYRSKALRVNNNGTDVGYCIQAATDQKNKLFVHAEIGGTNDKRELAPMALEVKNLLDLRRFKTLSDAGYSTGDQFAICKKAGVETYSAPMPTTAPSYGCIPTAEFSYNKEKDYYICPMGEHLHNVGNPIRRGNYYGTIYRTKACKTCSMREDCTKNKHGRIVERSEHQDVIDENRERVLSNPAYYKQRQQIIEHQFGVFKRQWGFTFTLLKEKINVMSEVNLLMMVYNLTRMVSIMGINEFKRKLGSFLVYLMAVLGTIKANFVTLSRFTIFTTKFSKENYLTI